eukprot:1369806-Pleurochrysis_carterae.AAC.1
MLHRALQLLHGITRLRVSGAGLAEAGTGKSERLEPSRSERVGSRCRVLGSFEAAFELRSGDGLRLDHFAVVNLNSLSCLLDSQSFKSLPAHLLALRHHLEHAAHFLESGLKGFDQSFRRFLERPAG